MMKQRGTLERSWMASVNGYPIRVEEHRYDLSYIVEFYDGTHDEGPCISHSPETGEELSLEKLSHEEPVSA